MDREALLKCPRCKGLKIEGIKQLEGYKLFCKCGYWWFLKHPEPIIERQED